MEGAACVAFRVSHSWAWGLRLSDGHTVWTAATRAVAAAGRRANGEKTCQAWIVRSAKCSQIDAMCIVPADANIADHVLMGND